MQTDYVQLFVSVPNKKIGQQIASVLLERKLAACIQIIGPIESHYIWEDIQEKENEFLCLIKSNASQFKNIEKAIIKLHPYDTPEIIETPITQGSKPYLDWIEKSQK
jgi:periplasmic divalent cation tolerance protein